MAGYQSSFIPRSFSPVEGIERFEQELDLSR